MTTSQTIWQALLEDVREKATLIEMEHEGERATLLAQIERLQAERKSLRMGITAVGKLISESRGVVGLHLNGDESPWEELLAGGRYEGWLRDFSRAEVAGGNHGTE